VLATIEVAIYALNESIAEQWFHAVDIGGSMTIHTFGAYFGLAACFFYHPTKAAEDKGRVCGSSYNSNLIAMIGTLFLFMYWPSFNGAQGEGIQ